MTNDKHAKMAMFMKAPVIKYHKCDKVSQL